MIFSNFATDYLDNHLILSHVLPRVLKRIISAILDQDQNAQKSVKQNIQKYTSDRGIDESGLSKSMSTLVVSVRGECV